MYEVVPGAGQRDWHLGERVIFSPISWFTTAGRRIQVGVKTAAAGGHGGFGRHLLSNLLSSLDERNEEEDRGERGRWKRCVERKKKEKDGRRNWNTDRKLLDEKPSLMYALHGCIMYYTDRETFFRNISLLSGLRGSFPFCQPILRDARLFRERILGRPHKFWPAVHKSIQKYLPPT